MKQRTTELIAALSKIGIPAENRTILCLDGGGVRGILTIQLLKKFEDTVGMPCCRFFDMVAGTSTGGIITGMIASGKTAVEIETLYKTLVNQVFIKKTEGSQLLNPPEYDKASYRRQLESHLGNATLKQTCEQNQIDLMITAKDVTAGEETFFSYFRENEDPKNKINTYQDVLLRAVIETTGSAPTYFSPFERFVDGGVTAFNNPSLPAILEATQYGPKDKMGKSLYQAEKLTVISLGTGCSLKFVTPQLALNPDVPDAYFWLEWLMNESGDDASDTQTYLLRSGLIKGLDYRRFQISLDKTAVSKLPNRSF